MIDNLIVRLGLSLVIGLVVGLERGWREREAPDGSRTAGIRTYGLCGLLGGVFAALSESFGGPAIFVIGFLGFAGIFSWFKSREAKDEEIRHRVLPFAWQTRKLGGESDSVGV